MNFSKPISRRSALKIFGSAGALTVCMPMASVWGQGNSQAANDLFGDKLGPFVQINPDNSIIIGAPIPDMGTGISTTLPMIVANELDANWEEIVVETFPVAQYQNNEGEPVLQYVLQGTGGSGSVTNAWDPLRECGALARYIILRAAAEQLSQPLDNLGTKDSHIIVQSSGKEYPYSDFALEALKVKVPGLGMKIDTQGSGIDRVTYADADNGGPRLKDFGRGSIIGQPKGQKAALDIVTGREEFGIDKNIEGQLHAQIERCPHFFGSVKSFDASGALKVKGVVDVIEVPNLSTDERYKFNSPGVAVLAESLWAAMKGREALKVVWNKGPNTHENNKWHEKELRDATEREDIRVLDEKGDVKSSLEKADKVFEAEYEIPFWAHFCMEPMNCAAWVKKDEVIVKLSHQYPENVAQHGSQITGHSYDQFKVDNGRLGGGYGRKARNDYMIEAIYLSQKSERAVKVIWTREDEVRHGFINPTSLHRIKAGVDENGKLIAWDALASRRMPARMEGFPEKTVPNSRLRQALPKITVPIGAWRGPAHNVNGFVHECMIDEIAVDLNRDPLAYRLEVIGEDKEYPFGDWTPVPIENITISTSRMKGVLRLAAEKAGWGRKMPKGQGRGIASAFTFGSYAAMVVDVSVDDNGKLTVLKVTGAADCGLVINPLGAKAQMEGGCMDGLSALLYQNIQFDDGRITTGNFDDIPLVRMDEAIKEFDFHFVDSDEIPTGLGEIALPPFIPALINAIFDATGTRIRKFPLGDQLKDKG